MSVKHIWGFGGVRLTVPTLSPDTNYDCTLPYAQGKLRFVPDRLEYMTLERKKMPITLGYRAVMEIEAYNTDANDFSEFKKLIGILNAGMSDGREIYCYPRYSLTDDNLYYVVQCTSDIDFESLAAVKAGQKITLSFESIDLVDRLPSLTSDPDTFDWVDHDGNTIIDHDGNLIQFSA